MSRHNPEKEAYVPPILLPKELHKEFKELCSREDTSMTGYLRKQIRRFVKESKESDHNKAA